MANKILLFISPAHVVAAHWRSGKLARCDVFSPDENGIAAFAGWLKTAGSAPAYLVADTVEEDYRFETLPHATGSDRASLLDRKIRHYYRSTRFVSTLFRGRVGDKRRDDRYLFSALTNPALVDEWVTAIVQHGSPVAGVYLAPTLTAGLMAKLKITLPRVLVAAPHQSGLRLTFFSNGEFCTSRLTRPIPKDPHDAAQMLERELSNTRLYLSTLHLDGIDETLSVVFLDREDRLAAITGQINAAGHGLECICVDRATLIRELPLSAQHLDLALETIYLGVLAEDPPMANLAPATVTAGFQLLRRKTMLYAASAAVGLAGLCWSGYNLWHAIDMKQQASDAMRQAAAAQVQYKDITRTFPTAPTTSENLIKAVSVYREVVKTVRSPQSFMQIVSRALDAQPEVFLQELSWHYGTDPLDTGSSPSATGAPVQTAGTNSETLRQRGMLIGEIRPFQGDFRAAISSINRVAERLARDPAVAEVKVVKLPLNVNPELALNGDTRDSADAAGIAEFKIMLTLKPNA